jgi:NADH dehydrogenase/NADH:ubiquinone oxidoreductase subunit G
VEASCTYPVRDDGLKVETNSEQVQRYRRLNMELLLARCPDSEQVRRMAREMGVEQTRVPQDGKDRCVLCGLCVNVCHDLVGAGAISFVGRGSRRRVDTPYGEPSEVCIGCGACAEVCPTGHIVVRESEGEREIVPFGTKHKLVACPECGRGYVTEKQLAFLEQKLGEKSEILGGCPVCKGRRRAEELQKVYESLSTPRRN